jgi:hypothetical protein
MTPPEPPPLPEPYQPPKPDTSLAASIKRLESYNTSAWDNEGAEPLPVDENHNPYGVTQLFGDDLASVLEAAKKWNDLQRQTDKAMPNIKEALNEAIERQSGIDHDYIGESEHGKAYERRTKALDDLTDETERLGLYDNAGESWRFLSEGEDVKPGDEASFDKGKTWVVMTNDLESTNQHSDRIYRRRIEEPQGKLAEKDCTLIGIEPKELSRMKQVEEKWKGYDKDWVDEFLRYVESDIHTLRADGYHRIVEHLVKRGEK